jgi:hypothetical protein
MQTKGDYNKYSFDYVKQTIENDGNILLETTYKDIKTKIKIRCGTCETEYLGTFGTYLKGMRCKKCAASKIGINKRTAEDKIKEEVVRKGHIFIKSYSKQNRLHITYKCNKCSNQFDCSFLNYKSKERCTCESKREYTDHNSVKAYIERQGEILKSNYINSRTKLEIQCCKCNGIYKIRFDQYKVGSRCNCCNIYKKKTLDEVSKFISERGCKLLSKAYENCSVELEIQCNNCENTFKTTYTGFRQGTRCRNAQCDLNPNGKIFTHDYVENYIKQCGDKLMSQYDGPEKKVEILCGTCNKTFLCKFIVYKGTFRRCHCNKASAGERAIELYLINKNIKFERQKKINGCKNKSVLRFDFYLSDYDILIEFDGLQHFKAIEQFGGEKGYAYTAKNDIIKNIFCIQNNKKLLRIYFKQLNKIDNILDNYLDNHKNKNCIEFSNIQKYYNSIINTYDDIIKQTNQEIFGDNRF